MLNNYRLMALLEATKSKEMELADPFADDDANATDPEDVAADTNTEENTDNEAPKDDEANSEESNEDNQENNEDEENGNNDDETKGPDDSEDNDFNMDPDGGSNDSESNPDGLPDPDDDGSMDDTDGVEQNVHLNILELSKLDRMMAKRKIYNDYKDLRASITSAKRMIDQNEATIDATVRDYTMNKLDYLLSMVTDYLSYKFSFTNYEDNLQAYLIFTKQLNDLLNTLHDNKDGFKEEKSKPSKNGSKKPKEKGDDKIDVEKSIEEQEEESKESEEDDIDEDLDLDID